MASCDAVYRHAGYLGNLIESDRLKRSVKCMVKALRPLDFDTIAFRGNSGALIASPLAFILNKELILVRKKREYPYSHSPMLCEGNVGAKRYVIVDDFVSTGATSTLTALRIKQFAPQAECIGIMALDSVVNEIRPDGNYLLSLTDSWCGRRVFLDHDQQVIDKLLQDETFE